MDILRFHFNPVLRQLTSFTVSVGLLLNLVMVPLLFNAIDPNSGEAGRESLLVVIDDKGKITIPSILCHVSNDESGSGKDDPENQERDCWDCECCSLGNAISLSSSELNSLPSTFYFQQTYSIFSNFFPLQGRSGRCSPRAPPSLV